MDRQQQQQQHSALSAWEILFLTSFQPRNGLDPDVVGATWDWSLGMPCPEDGSSVNPMFTNPVNVPSRVDSG